MELDIKKFGFLKEAISSKKKFAKELARPFGTSRPWKEIPKWQKARIGGGTALNLAFGLPLFYGLGSAAVRKLTGRKDPAKKQLQKLKRETELKEQARKIVRYA